MEKFITLVLAILIVGTAYATPKKPKNLIANSSFETGLENWGYLYPPTSKLISSKLDATESFEGEKSFKIGNKGITCNPIPIPDARAYVFSFYAKSNSNSNQVAIVLKGPTESNSQIFSKSYKTSLQWQRFIFFLPALPQGSWTITIQSDSENVWIDALQFEKGEKPSAYHPATEISSAFSMGTENYGKILYPDDIIDANINIYNYGKTINSASLQYLITDYYGKNICEKTKEINLPSQKIIRKKVQIPQLDHKGFFLISYRISKDGKTLTKGTSSFLIINKPNINFAAPPYMGICFCPLEVLLKTGLNLQEFYVTWASIENKEGEINWNNMASSDLQVKSIDAFINSPYKNNFKIFALICDRWPKWSLETKGAFKNLPKEKYLHKFIYEIITRYKNHIKNWEFGAESNATWPAKYGYAQGLKNQEKYIKIAYSAAKKADPECNIGITRASGSTDATLMESKELLKSLNGKFDILSLDPYPTSRIIGAQMTPTRPEEIASFLKKAASTSLKYNGKGIDVHEIGWMCDKRSLTPGKDFEFQRQYADYISRMSIISLAEGSKDINWWIFEDIQRRGNYDYGLWHTGNNCPLPALGAYLNILNIFNGFKKVKTLQMGMIKTYVFELPKGVVAALWFPGTEHIERKGEIILPSENEMDFLDIQGNKIVCKKTNNKAIIPLSTSPVFIKAKIPLNDLAKIIENAKINAESINIEVQIKDLSSLQICISNTNKDPVSGKIKITAPWTVGLLEKEKNYNISPGKTEALDFKRKDPLFSGIANAEINIESIPLRGRKNSTTSKMQIFPCQYTSKKINIDGNLSDWKKIDYISLQERKNIYPPDAAWGAGSWQSPEDASIPYAYTAWDKEFFYFAAKIKDDVHLKNSSPKAGTIPWGMDCVQIAFDMSNDASAYNANNYNDNDYEFILSAIKDKSDAIYRSFPYPRAIPKGSIIKIKREKEFTVYELALPWSSLSLQHPKEGKVFGFNFIFADADDLTGVHYSVGLTPGICHGKKPSSFKDFALVREWQTNKKKTLTPKNKGSTLDAHRKKIHINRVAHSNIDYSHIVQPPFTGVKHR